MLRCDLSRVVVLSDIHGNAAALEAVWADITRRNVDHVLCLGDLIAFGPHPVEVLNFLAQEVKPSVVLRGNTDRYLLERVWDKRKKSSLPVDMRKSLGWTGKKLKEKEWEQLASLGEEQAYSVEQMLLFLCHASPGNDEKGVIPGESKQLKSAFRKVSADVVLCGHTHLPGRTQVGGKTVLNTGSVGMPYGRDPRASYLSFIVSGGALYEISFCRVSYPNERVVLDLQSSKMPNRELFAHRIRTATDTAPRVF